MIDIIRALATWLYTLLFIVLSLIVAIISPRSALYICDWLGDYKDRHYLHLTILEGED